jgi:hypothetical protein
MADMWTKRSDGSTIWSDRQGNVSAPIAWTTATRPVAPFDGQTGRNTDFNGLEEYVASLGKWRILSGTWTTNTRPVTTLLAAGSRGDNTDTGMGPDYWNGTDWENK